MMLGTGAKCRDEQLVRRSLAQNGWSGKAAAPRMAPPPELSPTKGSSDAVAGVPS